MNMSEILRPVTVVASVSLLTVSSLLSQITSSSPITTVAGDGPTGFCGDGGPANAACLSFDGTYQTLAITKSDELVLAANNRIRKISRDGIINTVAGDGGVGFFGDGGPALEAALDGPSAVTTDNAGNIYFADSGNGRIRKVDTKGLITTYAGGGSTSLTRLINLDILNLGLPADSIRLTGIRQLEFFEKPSAVLDKSMWLRALEGYAYIRKDQQAFGGCCPTVRDSNGIGYRTVTSSHKVFRTGGDLAGTGIEGFSGDGGPALKAKLSHPGPVAVDSLNNVYVADNGNFRIRMITPAGIISTVVGTGQDSEYTEFSPGDFISSGDGGPAGQAKIGLIYGMVFDSAGNLYFAERARLSTRIRKVSASGLKIPQQGVVNSAAYLPGSIAPESWVSVFGEGIAPSLIIAATLPLPTELGGTSVVIVDSTGARRTAFLQFVAPTQLNFLVPRDTSLGLATVQVSNSAGQIAGVQVQIARVAPGLFSANGSGSGPAAAGFIIVNSDGNRTEGLTFQVGTNGARENMPLDLGSKGDQVYLVFYGTGFRSQSSVSVKIGGISVPVLGAVAQGQFDGLDQVNVGPLPTVLAGRGDVQVVFTFDGLQANPVTVNVK